MTTRLPLAILGSTGSIGEQTLSVVRENPDAFEVVALTAGKNGNLLAQQAREFQPSFIALADATAEAEFEQSDDGKEYLRSGQLLRGSEGVCQAAALPAVSAIVMGISGFAAFEPVLAALQSGKHIALANKECLVAGGSIFKAAIDAGESLVVPVDSEHNSIYQCLARRGCEEKVRRIILTASGGPFLETPLEQFGAITPQMAVRHPRWSMGRKISVDSATLMNKALEVIEASVLFGLEAEKVQVLVHPESIVHGLVEYEDGSMLAACYQPDMRVPITYALKVIAKRVSGGGGEVPDYRSGHSRLDLGKLGALRFFDPDPARFPALALAYRALADGKGAPAVLNAANEVAVQSFLAGSIGFSDIVSLSAAALDGYRDGPAQTHGMTTISDVKFVDSWGRAFASEYLAKSSSGTAEGTDGNIERSRRAVIQ